MNRDLIDKVNGMYIIHQPMPYPLQENNAYLAETDNGWAVIDLGVDLARTRELWHAAVREAGIGFSSIKKIIVTHCHPDHLGAAAWMQRMTGAPVYMSKADRNIAQTFAFFRGDKHAAYEEAIAGNATRKSYGEENLRRLVNDWCGNVLPLFPEPEFIDTLGEGDNIVIDGHSYGVRIFQGHTDGQLALWSGGGRMLFSGDIFAENSYLHFTDWPHTKNDQPLSGLLSSIKAVEDMEPEIIFPGHGKPVSSYKDIFSKLRSRHERMLDRFEQTVTEDVTVGELYRKMFPVPQTGEFADYIHLHRVLAGETRGYLNHLAGQGRLFLREEGGVNIYSPCENT